MQTRLPSQGYLPIAGFVVCHWLQLAFVAAAHSFLCPALNVHEEREQAHTRKARLPAPPPLHFGRKAVRSAFLHPVGSLVSPGILDRMHKTM